MGMALLAYSSSHFSMLSKNPSFLKISMIHPDSTMVTATREHRTARDYKIAQSYILVGLASVVNVALVASALTLMGCDRPPFRFDKSDWKLRDAEPIALISTRTRQELEVGFILDCPEEEDPSEANEIHKMLREH